MMKQYLRIEKKLFVLFVAVFGFVTTSAFLVEIPIAQGNSPDSKSTDFLKQSESQVYDLLIIAPRQFEQALQPLIVHKIAVGLKTHLVTVDEVYQQMFWHGRDDAEKIKYFIKTAKEEWGITYVMLVGDFQKIPVRYVFNADNNSFWDEPCFISELYYADLYDQNGDFSTWDSSNNGVYGEWYGDVAKDQNIDLFPMSTSADSRVALSQK